METIIVDTTIDKVELPEIVYKYRDWNNPDHKRVLINREFYFAAPFECQEQYECNLPTDYDSLTDETVYKFYYQTAPSFGFYTHQQRDEIAHKMTAMKPFNDLNHRANTEQLFRSKLNQTLSLFCVSPFKENFNLWEVFADSQTGFCVGIDTAELIKDETLIGSGGFVNYYPTGSPPSISAISLNDNERLEKMMKVIYSLPDIYHEEKEYRFAKLNLANRIFTLPAKCFREVIIGNSMPDKSIHEVAELVETNLPGCKLYQAKADINTEKYEFIALN